VCSRSVFARRMPGWFSARFRGLGRPLHPILSVLSSLSAEDPRRKPRALPPRETGGNALVSGPKHVEDGGGLEVRSQQPWTQPLTYVSGGAQVPAPVESPTSGNALVRVSARFASDAALFVLDPQAQVIRHVAYERPAGKCEAWDKTLGVSYRRGQHLPGRVWDTEKAILIPEVDSAALAAVELPQSVTVVERIRSTMLIPIRRQGLTEGVIALSREEPPWLTEQEFQAATKWIEEHAGELLACGKQTPSRGALEGPDSGAL
jgi:hypothetical protein